MNLVIDVGNTQFKLAVFENDQLIDKSAGNTSKLTEILKKFTQVYPKISHCMVSSVTHFSAEDLSSLRQNFKLIELSTALKLPFSLAYKTPQTLGVDRIALASAAAVQYANRNVLVIDAGTCITYDFISADANYLGGAISPGINMRFKALHTFTSKLPLLEAQAQENLIGNSTETSLQSGVLFGVLYEIDGFIQAYSEKYDNLTIILTGGDAHFLRDRLKNDIFANSNFLLEGLNYILEHNKS